MPPKPATNTAFLAAADENDKPGPEPDAIFQESESEDFEWKESELEDEEGFDQLPVTASPAPAAITPIEPAPPAAKPPNKRPASPPPHLPAPQKRQRKSTPVRASASAVSESTAYFNTESPSLDALQVLVHIDGPGAEKPGKGGTQFYQLGQPVTYNFRNTMKVPSFRRLEWYDDD